MLFRSAVLDVAVAYKEDPDRVMEIIAAITEDMRKDEKFGQMILEPVDIGGVDQFGDSAVTIRARIKTRPVTQWGVAREFRRRLKKRFGELGIEIPYPQRTVHIAGPWPGAAEGTSKKDKT